MNKITYHYRESIERGNGNGYSWHMGYSENASDGSVTYPWMTQAECRQDAHARNAKACFESTQLIRQPFIDP